MVLVGVVGDGGGETSERFSGGTNDDYDDDHDDRTRI